MRSEKKDIDSLRSEGDLNISPRRRAWAKEHIDAETQRWWKETDPCQMRIPAAGEGEWWTAMEEVFHHD